MFFGKGVGVLCFGKGGVLWIVGGGERGGEVFMY